MKQIIKCILVLLMIVILNSCKINQVKNKQREGLWIIENTIGDNHYKSRGRFRKGDEAKTWRFYTNKKLSKIEVYKGLECTVTNYYENGKILSQGKTRMDVGKKNAHWYYFGEWKYYDSNDKLTTIKTYDDGKLISVINP
jgi:antitoxin component YwqK of YwqJK toxin-antitoxin module